MDELLSIAGNQYVEFGDVSPVSVLADFFGVRPGEKTLLECRAVDIEQPD
ncbi:hypothetical protein [Mesorhizobium sp. M1295]